MAGSNAEQLALDGLAPRKRRRKVPAQRVPAEHNPIAQVILDVQATQLGATFDYLVQSKDDEVAQPGVRVRVRFGHQLLFGFIWQRVASSSAPPSALRYIERVVSPQVAVSAQNRADITDIAHAYGGTRANILRMAVPPRVARVDVEQQLVIGRFAIGASDAMKQSLQTWCDEQFDMLDRSYDRVGQIRASIAAHTSSAYVWNVLPGVLRWAHDAAWTLVEALLVGKSGVMVLPDMRHVLDLVEVLQGAGLRRFAPTKATHGSWDGDFAVLGAALPPEERYRAFQAVASGQIRCVIGTRAVMYAPVEGSAVFAIMDDNAYQNADGFMPYAHARGVLRLRARNHHGTFIDFSAVRSPISQWEIQDESHEGNSVCGISVEVRGLRTVTQEQSPWIRWLNHEELVRLADPAIGARVPHTAVAVILRALKLGPVLLSIPREGAHDVLCCGKCHHQARCNRCTGPLNGNIHDGHVPHCLWCGAAAVDWSCANCGNESMRVLRVGAQGTAAELKGLFRHVPIVVSTPSQPRGVVRDIVDKPQIVIATPGAEPRVRPVGRATDPSRMRAQSSYQAVAILDAWASLYAFGVDARIDTLTDWMHASSLCLPRTQGGQVMLIGETDPVLAQSLMLWDSGVLAQQELKDREATALPPFVAAACVWGNRDAVMNTMNEIGALAGDYALMEINGEDVPGLLGPVSIAPPRNIAARQLEGTHDRVRAIVRVRVQARDELALRLRSSIAKHMATRNPKELHFKMDPKDLM
ncbi:primosomal protein N' [Bifidobacterium aquikefiri]|uniref:primosomal protein N' family DNA-binding protein n=1 Tax=Bifidobacterium aquikefiri TaxID=1653207 RepID=UPI0039E75781